MNRTCTTIIYQPGRPNHIRLPKWLDPDCQVAFDKRKDGTWRTWPEWYMELKGEAQFWEDRRLWLAGQTDVRGNWWCGQCSAQCQMINAGEERGYPDLYAIYQLPITRDRAGYEGWLWVAQYAGVVTCATVVDILKGRIRVQTREE